MIDDGLEGSDEALERLHAMGGRCRVVGITGPPGAGKSTLINNLIREGRKRDQTVAVLAVDPTSPYSGGAVLGDRVRMQEHATDPGVYIRSLATRGHMGGLSRSVQHLITLLDAAGFDLVLLETVGVGQEEVEVKDLAQTTVFVTVPGLGDGIQAMKAGVLEIAHIYLVNKADRPMTETTVKDLESMLSMSEEKRAWHPSVLTSIATEGTGVQEVMEELDRHYSHLQASGGLENWRRSVADASVAEAIRGIVEESLKELVNGDNPEFESDIDRVSRKEEDPMSVARRWLGKLDFGKV
ncbi:MAG: methylmalonyl Co-A mutase-associated GTPase MeaB [bacterium]|nr:MAG: methylmalonyl Co-A mutase-associated GTPase MeaB [bacterium]